MKKRITLDIFCKCLEVWDHNRYIRGSHLGGASAGHTEACPVSIWCQIFRLKRDNTMTWLLFSSAEVWQSAGRKIRSERSDNSLTLPRQPLLSVNKILLPFKLEDGSSLGLFLSAHYTRQGCVGFQLSLAKRKKLFKDLCWSGRNDYSLLERGTYFQLVQLQKAWNTTNSFEIKDLQKKTKQPSAKLTKTSPAPILL